MSECPCPCRGCKAAFSAGQEAGKLIGAEEERKAILTILDDEAARLNREGSNAAEFGASWVRHAARVVRLWRVGEELEGKPKGRLRAWLA